MAEKLVKVTVKKNRTRPHTHRGRQVEDGETLEVVERRALLLLKWGVIDDFREKKAKSKKKDTETSED